MRVMPQCVARLRGLLRRERQLSQHAQFAPTAGQGSLGPDSLGLAGTELRSLEAAAIDSGLETPNSALRTPHSALPPPHSRQSRSGYFFGSAR